MVFQELAEVGIGRNGKCRQRESQPLLTRELVTWQIRVDAFAQFLGGEWLNGFDFPVSGEGRNQMERINIITRF